SSRRRHTRSKRDWSSDVCSSDLHDPYPHTFVFLLVDNFLEIMCIPFDHPKRHCWCIMCVFHARRTWFFTCGWLSGIHYNIPNFRSAERRVGKEWHARGASACMTE